MCQEGIKVFCFLSARSVVGFMHRVCFCVCVCSLVHAGTVKPSVCIWNVCVCVCVSSILSCVSFLGVSKGNRAVVIECAFAVFCCIFFLPIERRHSRRRQSGRINVKSLNSKVRLRAFSSAFSHFSHSPGGLVARRLAFLWFFVLSFAIIRVVAEQKHRFSDAKWWLNSGSVVIYNLKCVYVQNLLRLEIFCCKILVRIWKLVLNYLFLSSIVLMMTLV